MISKQQCQQVLDALVDKELTFGCQGSWKGSVYTNTSFGHFPEWRSPSENPVSCIDEILGHPILKCDVEERYRELLATGKIHPNKMMPADFYVQLSSLWAGFKFITPLQSILDKTEWKEEFVKLRTLYPERKGECTCKRSAPCGFCQAGEYVQVPKSPLFEFLYQLFIKA